MTRRDRDATASLSRGEALEAATRIIALSVADLAGLAALLDIARYGRLAQGLRARLGATIEVGGRPRPDRELWSAAARRMIGGRGE